ncbi:MAG: sialidase family protein [bacterium]|nr:sialidase family protein [bacterium]
MPDESYLDPPQHLGEPEEIDLRNQRDFQGIPGIERTVSGRLWAAWYGGGKTEDHHNRILLTTSANNGRTWSEIKLVIDPDGDGPVRAFDPCLWHDPNNRLWLFWSQGYEKQADERSGVWAITTHESDVENPSWTKPKRLCDGIMMNKPTTLSSGEWLLPVARWRSENSAGVCGSPDQGNTWNELGRANIPEETDRNCDEHMLVERQDGSLWMWVRTRYGIGHSISTDRGRTWTPVAPSELQHPASRFFIRRLHSGNLLLVKHGPLNTRTERSHLTAYLSENDGQTWTGGLLLDERTRVSYPDGVQAPDGTIYLIYDRERTAAREILLACFTEDDIAQGVTSSSTALRLLVNKAQ